MTGEPLVLPSGAIRRDDDAVARITSAMRKDSRIRQLVDDIADAPAAQGAFGLLFPAIVRATGAAALVKVNAAPWEAPWLDAVHRLDPGVAPAVFGWGSAIAELRVGWMAIERLPFQPPGLGGPQWYAPLLEAAFRWQDAASNVSLECVHSIDGQLVASWIDDAIELDGTRELRLLRDRFDDDWVFVSATCPAVASHGDVHFFNAGSRTPGLPDTLVLFDPIPRLAAWPYDSANCQTLTNYTTVVPDGPPLVARAAAHRRRRGLATPDDRDVARVSALFCAWLAVMWRMLFRDTQPGRRESAAVYVEGAVRQA